MNGAHSSAASELGRTEGTAIASLVLGIVGFFALGPLAWVPGIICGHIARGRIRADATLAGDGMALAGLITSYVGMILIVLAIVILVFFFGALAWFGSTDGSGTGL